MAEKISVDDIKNFVKTVGYVEDRWGNLKKEANGKIFRFKFQATSVRFESGHRSEYDGKMMWVKIGGDYYKNIRWHFDGRLVIGSKIFGKRAAQ